MRNGLKFIIIFLIIIIFSGLGVSSYKEGIDCQNGTYDSSGICCANGQYNSNGVCCLNNQVNYNGKCIQSPMHNSTIDSDFIQNPNNIYVIIFLIFAIIWLLIIKRVSN